MTLPSAIYRRADCCALVYDITNAASFEHILNWKQNFMTKSLPESPESFPFLVLGIKCDLEDQRKVSTLDARKFC